MTSLPPLVVNLGKVKRKTARKLKAGDESVAEQIQESLQQALKDSGQDMEGKVVLPVVLLFERKPKKKRPFGGRLF